MLPMMATKKPPTPTMIRWTDEDYRVVMALRKKLGIKIPDLIRQALRTLAQKENLTA